MRFVAGPRCGVLALAAVTAVASMSATLASQQRSGRGAQAPAAPVQPQRPAARADAAVPFKVGETLVYDVSWSSLVTAGSATATVLGRKPAASGTGSVWEVSAEGRPVS